MLNFYPLSKTERPGKTILFKVLATFLTLFLILSLKPNAHASHYSSGEIFYKWIGNEPGKDSLAYRVYVTLFRNVSGAGFGTGNLTGCAHIPGSTGASFSFTLTYQNPNFPLSPAHTITPTNPYGWENTGAHPFDGSGWDMPDSDICANSPKTISEYRYVGEVTLPRRSSNWNFSIDPPCCRDGNDNLARSGNFHISANLNNSRGPNSSPRILSFTQFALCVISDSARPHRLNLKAQDGDGDSLFYQFDPQGSLERGVTACEGSQLGFNPGLSAIFPFPAHRAPFFDQKNAQLIFAPSHAGSYVVKVRVTELRPDTNGTPRVIGHSTLELLMSIAAQCRNTQQGFIKTSRDSVIQKNCGDSTFTVKTDQLLDNSTLVPNATDFALITSRNTLVPLSAVELQNRSNFRFELRDTLSINDTMRLIIRKGLDSNSVFNICGIPYKEFDTLATVISSGCKIDTNSGVGLAQLPADLLSLYPNPATDYIQFKSAIPLKNSEYQIYNATGTMVKQGSLSRSEQRISTADLSPGVYWITLKNNDFTAVKRFLKK